MPTTLPQWVDKLQSVATALFRVPTHWPPSDDFKVVHDAVWGTRRFDGWEIALIDLGAVQRLRRISQLSLAYLTYPTAVHNRFDHSLGVASITKEMIREAELDDASNRATAIAAAILHDIGHGPFSHLSEETYAFLPDLFRGLTHPANEAQYPNGKPHEVIGALLLKTQAAKSFFAEFNARYPVQLNPDLMGNIIAGNGLPGAEAYAEVVNGDHDADKIDYLHRDSHFSGIPLSVDRNRLLYSLKAQVPPGGQGPVLILTEKGAIPAEQLLFAKATLFGGLYHHQKVRAADCAYKSVIERLLESGAPLSGITISDPADVLMLTDADFFVSRPNTEDDRAAELLRRLTSRDLPHRALVLNERNVELVQRSGPTPHDSVERGLWKWRDVSKANQHKIYLKLKELREQIRLEMGHSALQLSDIWLDLPSVPNLGAVPVVVTAHGEAVGPKSMFPAESWTKIYQQYRYKGHVFAPKSYVIEANEAARRVLLDQLDVLVNDDGEEIKRA